MKLVKCTPGFDNALRVCAWYVVHMKSMLKSLIQWAPLLLTQAQHKIATFSLFASVALFQIFFLSPPIFDSYDPFAKQIG